MKRAILALFALSALFAVEAQQVYRTEFSVFDLREGALQNDHARTERHLLFNPKTVEVVDTKIFNFLFQHNVYPLCM